MPSSQMQSLVHLRRLGSGTGVGEGVMLPRSTKLQQCRSVGGTDHSLQYCTAYVKLDRELGTLAQVYNSGLWDGESRQAWAT